MKLYKNIFIILITVIIFTLTITFFLPLKAYASKSNASIEMEVKAGYDGIARLGTYAPFRVLLINKGRAVEGELQIEVKIDSVSKTAFSKPVSLTEGAVKEIVINAPVFTARRGVKVRFLEGKKVIKEAEYTFTKLIPPDIKTIGVLSSDNAAYSFLNGAMLPQSNNSAAYEKIKVLTAAGVLRGVPGAVTVEEISGAVEKVESILIPLTGEDLPEDIKAMVGFDILIISNFDTGTLSDKQLETLEKWVKDGGTLVIGTGASWKKTYNPLPEELKKFSVTDVEFVEPPAELEKFAGTSFSGNNPLNIVSGEIGFKYKEENVKQEDDTSSTEMQNNEPHNSHEEQDKSLQLSGSHTNEVIIGDNIMPLAVKYIYNYGRILFLAFDPGAEPVASWDGRQSFWEKLLFHSTNINRIYQDIPGYYLSNYNTGYYLEDLTEQVPDDKSPPFLFMFVTIAVYIIIVGPVMYILLKRRDKRDYNWIAIPATAFVFLLVIYLAGFRTRYRTAVMNTVSIINLDMDNRKADITTGMGIFNNKRGNLKLTYSENENIDFNIVQSGRRSYVVYNDGSEPEGKLVSRLLLTEPVLYEIFDVSLWDPKYLTAKRSEPLPDKIINSVQIGNGKIKAVINNTTGYDLMEAFISVGSNFISVGDIPSGQQKTVEADLDSDSVYKSFQEYLDARYGRTSYPINAKLPANYRENRRKRLLIERLLEPQYVSISGETKIGLYALNYQDLGFDIKINGENPSQYFTNVVFASMDMVFEKGKEFEIPYGIILPQIARNDIEKIGKIFDESEYGLRIREVGDIDFVYTIPEGLKISEFSLKFDTYVPLYVKFNVDGVETGSENMQKKILQNRYEYYIYNNASGSWEKINDTHIQSDNIDRYIDDENRLFVRVSVVEVEKADPGSGNEFLESEYLSYPALQLKGVVQ